MEYPTPIHTQPMSLPHALLTVLVERPSSGAELVSRFDRALGSLWQATHQQIYKELRRIEEAGWVESNPVEAGLGRKRVYQVLPAGRRELKRWVAEEADPRPLRDEILIRMRAEAAIGPAGLEADIARRLELHQDHLEQLLRVEKRDFADKEATREHRLRHLILKAGIAQTRVCIELSKEALEILRLPSTSQG